MLFDTGSYVIQSLTASFAVTSSHTLNAVTASYATLAQSVIDSGSLTVASASHAAEVQWSCITNRPNSTTEQIDSAVQLSHEHLNKPVLDGISESSVGSWDAKWDWNEEQIKGVKVENAVHSDNAVEFSESFASWISETGSQFSGTASYAKSAETLEGTAKGELFTDFKITGDGNGDLQYQAIVGDVKKSGSVSLAHIHSILSGDRCTVFIEDGQVVVEVDV